MIRVASSLFRVPPYIEHQYKALYQVSSLRSQLEYWNVGILGSGKLREREWDVGKINLTRLATN